MARRFTCMKCGHCKGCEKAGCNYRCYGCQSVESDTANTLFIRLSLVYRKLFVLYLKCQLVVGVLIIQMSKRFNIR